MSAYGVDSAARARLRRRLLRRQHAICPICSERLESPDPPHANVDHIIPPVDGGQREATQNLQLVHMGCNGIRGREDEWRRIGATKRLETLQFLREAEHFGSAANG